MKGKILADHMPINNYQLLVPGLPALTVVEVSGIEDTLNTTQLPDKTVASTGTRQATEVELTMPMHHAVEQAAMEVWFKESQDPVSPSYKKAGTLIHQSVSGKKNRTFSLIGMFPMMRGLPDLKMDDEGEMAVIKWKMSIDDIEPI